MLAKLSAVRLYKWSLCAIALSLPFLSPSWSGKVIGMCAILWLFAVKPTQIAQELLKSISSFLFLSSLFFLDMLGLVHTENIAFGLRYLETKLPFLIFALILLTSQQVFGKRDWLHVSLSLVWGIIIFVFFAFGSILLKLAQEGRIVNIFNTSNSSLVSIHPSYLSIYVSYSIFFLIDYYRGRGADKLIRSFAGVSILILVVVLAWLNSRAGLIGFVLAGLLYIFANIPRAKRWLALATLSSFLLAISLLPFTRERFFTAPLKVIELSGQIDGQDQSTWPFAFRLQIFKCNIELASKMPYTLVGYGTGDFRDKLYQCYEEKEFGWLIVRRFDPHSEFFAQLLRHGIIGLIVFLMYLGIPFVRSHKNEFTLYKIFIVLWIVISLTETVLSVQKGATFFALFNTLLYVQLLSSDRQGEDLTLQCSGYKR